jgi:hypothetical protein
MHMKAERFTGPLFLVGMPRSGTKLLRNMLNQHSGVRFSEIETEFFPLWVARWSQYGPIESQDGFDRFYRESLQLSFFVENAKRGIAVDREEWYRNCRAFTPASVYEALIRCILSIAPQDDTTIWGDKSPSYLRHVPLLIRQFPGARIIHIVRDVRDYSLSIRNAWGKSMLRAAQRWQDDVSKCRNNGSEIPTAYMEVRFEDLLTNPAEVLGRTSAFIGLEFDHRMLQPGAQTENLGDAKGMDGVLQSNWGKYRSRMHPGTVAKIEGIACATLRDLGYECKYQGEPTRVPAWKLRAFQLADGINLLRTSMADHGLVGALRERARLFRTSSTRMRGWPGGEP